MSRITIHIHPELTYELASSGIETGRALGAVSRRAAEVIETFGCHIAYAPLALPKGLTCAMSVRESEQGPVVEVDRPGTTIPGRGVVLDNARKARHPVRRQ